MMSIWANERTEIATWLSGYLNMVKTWVDKILDNEHYDVDKSVLKKAKIRGFYEPSVKTKGRKSYICSELFKKTYYEKVICFIICCCCVYIYVVW